MRAAQKSCSLRGEALPGGDTKRALAGVRVVITRAMEQAQEVAGRLRDLGAIPLMLPAVSFAPPQDFGPLDAAIGALSGFDWLFFTSVNAVKYFAERCGERGVKPEALRASSHAPMVAAVGPATSKAATAAGFRVDYGAEEFRGMALARELSSRLAGKKILLPRSNRASEDLPAALRASGAQVTDVIAYRTIDAVNEEEAAEALQALRTRNADVIAFFSPSGFRSVSEHVGSADLAAVAIAAIGPVTAEAIREAGYSVAIEARESTASGVIAALVEYFGSKASQGVRT